MIKIRKLSQNQNQDNFGYVYLLIPCTISEKALMIGILLKRKMQDYNALKPEIKALKLQIETENGQKPINI